MHTHPSQMEPLFPARNGDLEELARELVEVSAKLEGRLSPLVLATLRDALQVVNSYYSNLIEGHSTHPVDIERAMREEYSADQGKRDLQIESRIHIEVQRKIARRLCENPAAKVVSQEFLCWIHREFYTPLPEPLRWAHGEGEERQWVEAGVLRQSHVQVGRHIAPAPETLGKFLRRFESAYAPETMHGAPPLIAMSAAHHRLTWIHPFLDGNGRVARLFTDACFLRPDGLGLAGYGLWNVSRGLARNRDAYRRALSAADAPRENDLDGRGNLSNRGLTEFCRFFLEICLDQARYMNGLLALPDFLHRLEAYVGLRNAGLVVNADGTSAARLHSRVAPLLRQLAIEGEMARGMAFQHIGMSERTGRTILKGLLTEGLVTAKSEKGAIRLGFPAHAAGYWFPDLYPRETRP
ncbi:MAG: Fic family protein [Blastocatellia bacterium]|nr:Fic family protein [Blastocatellia bacterium]